MRRNNLINLLTNFFVILIGFYISVPLGILLVILRFSFGNKRNDNIAGYFFTVALFVLFFQIFNFISINDTVDNIFLDILESDLYNILYSANTKIFIVGILLLIITIVKEKISNSIVGSVKSYVKKSQADNYKIKKENDLQIKLKQERAKNNEVIKCPYCGADNIVSEKVCKCKYCRRSLQKEK